MSIATELNRIIQAKSDIITSLTAKGATVPSGATIDDLPDIIDDLPSGGGGDTEVLKDLIERDITTINIPSGITSIGGSAFRNCSSLTSVTIPNTVTSIGINAFQSCIGLTSITMGNSVTTIREYAFYGCSALTSITIPNSVTSIEGRVFQNCTGLTSVTIGNSVTSIANEVFRNCSSLASVTILATTPPTLSNANAFAGNASGRKIYVPSASVETYKTAANWSTYAADIEAIPSA